MRGASADSLVVYCAHDAIYAEQLLHEFERQSGIRVHIRFDTEATKSLGLVEQIVREREQPRCDVFWNNQLHGTLDLQQAGLLMPYQGPGHQRIAARYRDEDGYWTGFAGRLRVIIVNTDRLQANEVEVAAAERLRPERMAVANPLYGTTRTHYTVLWHRWGAERLKGWHRDMRERGLVEARGNAMVKNLVAQGTCDFGWTDSDDYYLAKDEGYPVAMIPFRLETGQTICDPNTVAIIRGTKKLEKARQLVDFLLSEATERQLAEAKSRQVPLGATRVPLPADVQILADWARDAIDLRSLDESRRDCLRWLREEYHLPNR